MGRERAFTAKVVMLRGKPTDQVGTIGIGGLDHWQLLCGFGGGVTAFTTE